MSDPGPQLLSATLARHRSALASRNPVDIEITLAGVEAALAGFDAGSVQPPQLLREFEAMVELYRAIRTADHTMQAQWRSSDVADRLVRLYYTLRSVQGSLAMAYAIVGVDVPRPETSPVGSAIGIYDAPKILSLEMHLRSGSYDTVFPYFVRWLQEIGTDLEIRFGDYLSFFSERDANDARAAVQRLLGLGSDGLPRLLTLQPGGANDPARSQETLSRRASDPKDIVGAARAIQDESQRARLALISLRTRRGEYEAQLGTAATTHAESALGDIIRWPFPVGKTPLFELQREQEDFDELLSRVPQEAGALRAPVSGWQTQALEALRRACTVEQSLRDHVDEYRARYPDPRWRRGFRWYIWEFLNLVDQSTPRDALGARPRT